MIQSIKNLFSTKSIDLNYNPYNDIYEIYDFYGESYPHQDWTGRIARTRFNELMKQKKHRLQQLTNLLKTHHVDLDYSKESLQRLNDFVCHELEAYMPNIDKNNPYSCEHAELPYFRSLSIDCTLYL